MTRKVFGWGLLVLLVLWVAHDPVGAAHTGRHVGSALSVMADGVGRFVGALFGGK